MLRLSVLFCILFAADCANQCAAQNARVRMIVETDAGGDPDDEQSLVRLLVYANEFDIEGLIANRAVAREGENKNQVRDGLGIVRAMVFAYGACYGKLVLHDPRYPKPEALIARTVAGYDNTEAGVDLIIGRFGFAIGEPIKAARRVV